MTEADRVFARFPDFIKEYIYSRGWEGLRDVQLAAADVIFNSEDNLLLTSSTASGKTEAAFFPILSELCESHDTEGVSVLYIAPLKSLINDQFSRMEELLDMSGIPVYHWHGDVSGSHKAKVLRQPRGILQITPESLESMVMGRSNDLPRIFAGLRYVVIDEIHTMIGSDRGSQVICLLSRISRITGVYPRRVGLSATIGDTSLACAWLGAGSGRRTVCPPVPPSRLRWRLALEHFYIQDPAERQDHKTPSSPDTTDSTAQGSGGVARIDAGYEYLYDAVYGRRALVFSNSREETEYVTATLRQIAAERGERDVFYIHHGNLSAALREDAEEKMKDETSACVTCATVTMELGIDIGKLERVAQIDSPNSVSGFLQRIGRSGRRGNVPEMIMVFREETPLPNAPLPQLIPWGLLRAIAIVELYAEERFIEPPRVRRLPFSLAFHQTLSILASSGELSARELAERVLSLPPLSHLSREDYRELLISMVKGDYIQLTDEHGLIVGLRGERLINSYKFYAVFKDSEDFTVRCESEEIGTITSPPAKGERFALAGRVWEVLDADVPRRLIYVKPVEGKMEISWPGDSGEIHTRLLEKMREVLLSDKKYPYLMPNAATRLEDARALAKNVKLGERMLVCLGGDSMCLFPWLGTRAFRTLRRFISANSSRLGVCGIEFEGCCYMTFRAKEGGRGLMEALLDIAERQGICPDELVGASECPVFDKYDEYIPPELLRRTYAADRLCPEEVMRRLKFGADVSAVTNGTTGAEADK